MPPSAESIARAYVDAARKQLADAAKKIKHCLDQLSDEQVWWRLRESQNSIGNLVLHLCGNVRQWIVSGVGGEADTRDRPKEFAQRGPIAKAELIARLDGTIAAADAVLEALGPSQLLDERRIQGFDTTALSAVFDSLGHFNGHTQEIIYITRSQLGDDYEFQWTPSSPEQGAGRA